MNHNFAPRTPEKSETLYRGVVMELGDTALKLLRNQETMAPSPEGTEQLYKGAAVGLHVTSDEKTARLYADASSFIVQQKNPAASRNPNSWTIGVVNRIDNQNNKLGVEVAKPKSRLARFEKWVSHYIMGRTEFVTPAVPDSTIQEVYLFRGDELHATFTDTELAIDALAKHLQWLRAQKLGEDTGEEGKFIEPEPNAKIHRRVSTIDTDGFTSAATQWVRSKVQKIRRRT